MTGTVPEGCPANIYKSLAVTILSCFTTDHELVTISEINTVPVQKFLLSQIIFLHIVINISLYTYLNDNETELLIIIV